MTKLNKCIYLPVEIRDLEIEAFRKINDTLFSKCPAHITVVFPFDAPISIEAIAKTIEGICDGITAFNIIVGPPSVHDGYVSMTTMTMHPWISYAHEVLTKSIGGDANRAFIPHLTIGREIENTTQINPEIGVKNLVLWISEMVFEEIQIDGTSKVLFRKSLIKQEIDKT